MGNATATNVVIGAGSGMGAAVAQGLAGSGPLILADRNVDEAEKVAATLGDDCRVVACDVTDQAAVDALVETTGTLGALVLTAGLSPSMAAGRRVVEVNLLGTDRVVRAFERILQLGSVADPFMAWLLLRGLRTFHIRMPAHFRSAMEVARFLQSSPKVSEVLYPSLDTHPQAALAKRQFRGGSGLLAFRLDTENLDRVAGFVDSLTLFKRAVSWGGYESLVFPSAASSPPGSAVPADRLGLVRLHIGLEESPALIEDLSRALKRI